LRGRVIRWLTKESGQANILSELILLKKSKIAEIGKSRECRMLVIAATAELCRTSTSAGEDFFNTIGQFRTGRREMGRMIVTIEARMRRLARIGLTIP
jgi:hypothetical protein